ncbi:hypothetical protein [Galactobacter valiniphilus]|uniref:hypothetical protein n=1 Tax=Galactobacter valiniphilus TaxID=2676122 RepID=UPI003736AD86
MARSVALGGELKGRGLIGGRSKPETWFLIGAGLIAAAVLLTGMSSLWSLVFAAAIAGAGLLLSWPAPLLGGRSVIALLTEAIYTRVRARQGTNVFDPQTEAEAAARVAANREHAKAVLAARKAKQPAPAAPGAGQERPAQLVAAMKRAKERSSQALAAPLFFGKVQIRQVPCPDGSMIAVARHANTADAYYSVVFEVQGKSLGAVESDVAEVPFLSWGAGFLAQAARRTHPVSHVQSFTRSVPADMVDHVMWLKDFVDGHVSEEVLRSYQQLTTDARRVGEQHRSYVVLRFDKSEALSRLDRRFAGYEDARERGIAQEAHTLMAKGRMGGSFEDFRPVDGTMLMGLLAHLQNPYRFDVDAVAVTPETVFSHLDGSITREAVVADGRAYTRTGYIPRNGFAGDEISVRTMNQFVSTIQPAVVHSVSWINKLEDAAISRGKARRRRATSVARKRERDKRGQVGDGTEEVLLSADTQRAMDLKPNSGHHGAEWAAYISFTVASEEELYQVSSQIEAQAFDAGIERIEWLDGKQDLALAAVMPLGRGIR